MMETYKTNSGLKSSSKHCKQQLPEGWILKASRRYPDKLYYFNTLTGKSTWVLPGFTATKDGQVKKNGVPSSATASELMVPSSVAKKRLLCRQAKSSFLSNQQSISPHMSSLLNKSQATNDSNNLQNPIRINFVLTPKKSQFSDVQKFPFPSDATDISSLPSAPKDKISVSKINLPGPAQQICAVKSSNDIPASSVKCKKKKKKSRHKKKLESEKLNVEKKSALQSTATNQKLFPEISEPTSTAAHSTSLHSTKSKRKPHQNPVKPVLQREATHLPGVKETEKRKRKLSQSLSESEATKPKRTTQKEWSESLAGAPEAGWKFDASVSDSPVNSAVQDEAEMEVDPFHDDDMMIDLQEIRENTISDIKQAVGMLTESVQSAYKPPSPSHSSVFHQMLFIIVDTNVLIGGLKFVQNLRDIELKGQDHPHLVIPWMVMQELDSLKGGKYQLSLRNNLQSKAQEAVRYLHSCLISRHPRVRGQTPAEASEVLPQLPIECNDDHVLQCCEQYKKKYPGARVLLLTEDKNLQSKATIMNIESVGMKSLQPLLTEDEVQQNVIAPQGLANDMGEIAQACTVPKLSAVRNGIERKLVDELMCGVKQALRLCLSPVARIEMEAAYENLWTEIVFKKPPWSAHDLVCIFHKHWIAVFGLKFQRPVFTIVENLMKMLDPRKSMRMSEVECCIQSSLELVQSIKTKSEYAVFAKQAESLLLQQQSQLLSPTANFESNMNVSCKSLKSVDNQPTKNCIDNNGQYNLICPTSDTSTDSHQTSHSSCMSAQKNHRQPILLSNHEPSVPQTHFTPNDRWHTDQPKTTLHGNLCPQQTKTAVFNSQPIQEKKLSITINKTKATPTVGHIINPLKSGIGHRASSDSTHNVTCTETLAATSSNKESLKPQQNSASHVLSNKKQVQEEISSDCKPVIEDRFQCIWSAVYNCCVNIESLLNSNTCMGQEDVATIKRTLAVLLPVATQLRMYFSECLSFSPLGLERHANKFQLFVACLNEFFLNANVEAPSLSTITPQQMITFMANTNNRVTLSNGLRQLDEMIVKLQCLASQLPE